MDYHQGNILYNTYSKNTGLWIGSTVKLGKAQDYLYCTGSRVDKVYQDL